MDADEHCAARVAEVELHLGMLRKLGLAILIIGQRRQLTPAVKSVEPEPKRRVGADRLMTDHGVLQVCKALPPLRRDKAQ